MEQCAADSSNVQVQAMRLEGIEEEGGPAEKWAPKSSARPPETPTETMEFLARSWSLSAAEISRALKVLSCGKATAAAFDSPADETERRRPSPPPPAGAAGDLVDRLASCPLQRAADAAQAGEAVGATSPPEPVSPRANLMEVKLQLLRGAGGRGKTVGAWIKEQREKKRAEARSRNAQAYAATSVAGVAAAVAALVAGAVFSGSGQEKQTTTTTTTSGSATSNNNKTAAAVASAAALVASHCVEMAQAIGASHEQILGAIHSAVNAQSSGDVMALTAGAATALRGAAMLRARLPLHKEIQQAATDGGRERAERDMSPLVFVSRGGELLKRTRQGILHWKLVTVYINSSSQVVVKMQSAHMAGAFIKTKRCIVLDVCSDIPAWAGRELEDDGSHSSKRGYFGIRTPERVIEFECRNKYHHHKWVHGISEMLLRRDTISSNNACL